MAVTEEMFQELVLRMQALEDKLDKYLDSAKHNGVYTSEAPDYVKEYVKHRKLVGEEK